MNWIVVTLLVLVLLAILTYLLLPAFLRLLGIHRHYTIPDFDLKGRRALVVCTNHDRLDPLIAQFGPRFVLILTSGLTVFWLVFGLVVFGPYCRGRKSAG